MDVPKISALMVILVLHVQYSQAQGKYVNTSTSQTAETPLCINYFHSV